jgi:two-component system, LytTR family, sensor kinase
MSKKALVGVYVFFFFMYFWGFNFMGNANAGLPIPWSRMFEPLDLTYYTYTVLTVALAHFLVFRPYFHRRPRWKLILAIGVLLISFILFRYLLEEILFPFFLGYGNYNPGTSFRYYFVDNLYYGLIRIFIGFVLFLFDEMFRNLQQQAALKELNRKAELNFLQAQMNPHFLFNSLNNLYALALDKHPGTADAILKLGNMMRYVTYQREEVTGLDQELSYINNLLAIEQLRHDRPLQTVISVSPDAAAAKIPPLLLVPLVENALKHGDLSDTEYPFRLEITKENGLLRISLLNKISGSPAEKGGLGLTNLRRRLSLLYQSRQYLFETSAANGLFMARLNLPVSV